MGVDPGKYSRKLMEETKTFMSDTIAEGNPPNPTKAVEHAHGSVKLLGSSTASVVVAGRQGDIQVCNVGDSTFQLWRHSTPKGPLPVGKMPIDEAEKLWELVWMCPSQTHDFNHPMQLAKSRFTSDLVSDGFNSPSVPVQQGDLIVLGTDGLWDNLDDAAIRKVLARFDFTPCHVLSRMRRSRYKQCEEVEAKLNGAGTPLEDRKILGAAPEMYTDASVAEKERECRAQLSAAASMLATAAIRTGKDEKAVTPFALEAARYGLRYKGGKLDDTTVVCALVVADDKHFDVFARKD